MRSNYQTLISIIAKAEGKKKQVSAGNVREILCVMKLLAKDPVHFQVIVKYLTGA